MPKATVIDLANKLFDIVCYDPVMIPLLLRLDHVNEHNLSIDKLIESKRALRNLRAGN